jgi:hypothetical protein
MYMLAHTRARRVAVAIIRPVFKFVVIFFDLSSRPGARSTRGQARVLLRQVNKSGHLVLQYTRVPCHSHVAKTKKPPQAREALTGYLNLWCGEGDLFSHTALKTRKLYTTQSSKTSRNARRTRLSHTFCHTARVYAVGMLMPRGAITRRTHHIGRKSAGNRSKGHRSWVPFCASRQFQNETRSGATFTHATNAHSSISLSRTLSTSSGSARTARSGFPSR